MPPKDVAERRWTMRLLVLTVAGLALLVRGVLAGETLASADLGLFTYPNLQVLSEVWRAGEIPGWNPYLGLGGPLLGDAGMAPCYPGNVLLLIMSPLAVYEALVISHLALLTVGTWKLARRLGLSPMASCLTAFTLGFSGVSLGHVNTPLYVVAFGWFPWAALGLETLVHGERSLRSRLLAAGAFALMFLAGRPEYCLVAAGLAWILVQLRCRAPRAASIQLLLTGLLACGLTGFVLLPTLAAVVGSERALGLGVDVAGTWSLNPKELVSLLVPSPFGPGRIPIESVGDKRPWFGSLYAGVVPLACAMFALLRCRRARALGVVAGVLLVFALGTYTPIYRWVYPLVSWVRYPAKLAVPVTVLVAFMAGLGFDRLRSDGSRSLTVCLGILGGGALICATAVGALGLALAALLPVSIAALAALSMWVRRTSPRRRLLFLAVAELIVAGLGVVGTVPRELVEHTPSFVEAVRQAERVVGTPLRTVTLDRTWLTVIREGGHALAGLEPSYEVSPGAFNTLAWREALCPNTGMPYRVRTLRSNTPLLLRRTAAFRAESARRGADRDALFRLQGVNLLLFAKGDEAEGRRVLGTAGPYRLEWLEGSRPWVSVTDQWVAVRGADEALARVLEGLSEDSPVVVEGDLDPPTGEGALEWSLTPVVFTRDRLAFKVACSRPALLVLREAWDSGWRARIGKEPADLRVVDYLFRGVVVPEGESLVSFEYEAPGRTPGRVITLTTLLGLLLLGLYRRRSAALDPSGAS